jgi:hypothetical protein
MQVKLDHKVKLEQMVLMALQVLKVIKVKLDRLDHKVKQVHKDLKVTKAV